MGYWNKLILGLFIILLLSIAVVYTSFADYKTIKEQNQEIELLKQVTPIDHPLLSYEFDSWQLNSKEEFEFIGFVWNYGKEEGKEIEITCYVEDKNGKLLKKEVENVGSAASSSWTTKTIKMESDTELRDKGYIGSCYYTNSANGFNLAQNIKEYKDLIV